MVMPKGLLAVSIMGLLAGCGAAPEPDQNPRILRSDGTAVVLHGLIDASRKEPPPRYAALAEAECGKTGKTALFVSMEQKSTFGFDVTYACEVEI